MEVVSRIAPAAGAGDAVIRLAQPFGRWVKDLLEPQVYPEPRARAADRPYDVTAWTLGLQMGVTVNRLDTRVPLSLPRPDEASERDHRQRRHRVIAREANAAATLINRLWARPTIGWVDAERLCLAGATGPREPSSRGLPGG